jgi:thioredoxin-related protein
MKYLLAIIIMITVYSVQAQGIRFEESLTWAQIKAKAKSENKYILMDTYTTWCGPCKQMSVETFPKKEVGDFINEKFISIKVQIDKTSEDNEFVRGWYADAKMIEGTYGGNGYPTLLFFSPEGNIVYRAVGYQDAKGLINVAQTALKSDTDYLNTLTRFNKGTIDTAEMKRLISKAKELRDYKTVWQVADKYISHINKDELFSKINLKFIGNNLSSKSKFFNLFFKEPGKVNAIMGKNYAENIVMDLVYREEIWPFDKVEKVNWELIEKKTVSKYGKLGEERIWGNRMAYYHGMQDWTNFGKYYKKYFERSIPHKRSFIHINNMSWGLFEHISDTTILNVAVKAMEYDIDKNMRYDPAAIDTYANLLYKVGRKDDAIRWEDLARRLSNSGKDYVETLDKMKAGIPTWLVPGGTDGKP